MTGKVTETNLNQRGFWEGNLQHRTKYAREGHRITLFLFYLNVLVIYLVLIVSIKKFKGI